MMLTLAATGALAAPGEPADRGLGNACTQANAERPCALARIIPDTTVGAGETRTYEDGHYHARGTIIVEDGGTVIIDNATIFFNETSDGIIVRDGGTLIVTDSTFVDHDGSSYAIVADAGATMTFTGSRVSEGDGFRISANDTTFDDNRVEEIERAMLLLHTDIHVTNSTFVNNTVGVNQTGGSNTLSGNTFDGGEWCVRDWLANPTITNNVFTRCHFGIWHERSESTITDNTMDDEALPPGAGITVIDTESPVIEGNDISNYGTGILIRNARGFIRNNTIHDNVLDGIRVEQNSAPMDVQGNEIHGNGRDGIRLLQVTDVMVFENDVHDNAGFGIWASDSAGVTLTGNAVTANGNHGIVTSGTPNAVIDGNTATDNVNIGIFVAAGSDGTTVTDNVASGNFQGVSVTADNVQALDNEATLNSDAGFLVRGNGTLVSGGSAHNNSNIGIAVHQASGVTVQSFGSNDNGGRGFDVRFTEGTFTDVIADRNGGHGVFFEPAASPTVITTFTGLFARENALDGFRNAYGGDVEAHDGWFQDNAGAGVHNAGATTIDFTNNYWGSATGPTEPGNPLGTGDEIVGPVTYVPFLVVAP